MVFIAVYMKKKSNKQMVQNLSIKWHARAQILINKFSFDQHLCRVQSQYFFYG